MSILRTAYHYHHLSDKAKKTARKQKRGCVNQWLYNEDGTIFEFG